MYDLKRSFFQNTLTKQVATGQSIANEGSVLVAVEESGAEKVQLSAAAAGETVVGWSIIDQYTPAERVTSESGSVPAAAPFTINLAHTNLVGTAPAAQIRVWDATGAADLTQVAGAPAATQFAVNVTTGVVTFNAAEAGDTIVVYYKYNLTVQESRMLYHDRHVNAGASAEWGVAEVGQGQGEIWTDQFDVTQNYAGLAANALRSGATGLVTVGGNGTPLGRVIHAPTADLPLLGIAFTIRNLVGA